MLSPDAVLWVLFQKRPGLNLCQVCMFDIAVRYCHQQPMIWDNVLKTISWIASRFQHEALFTRQYSSRVTTFYYPNNKSSPYTLPTIRMKPVSSHKCWPTTAVTINQHQPLMQPLSININKPLWSRSYFMSVYIPDPHQIWPALLTTDDGDVPSLCWIKYLGLLNTPTTDCPK